METVSEEVKKKHAKAERGGLPSNSSFQIVNYLQLLGSRLPVGTALAGEVIKGLIERAEKKGVDIPACRWDDIPGVERRNLQRSFNSIVQDLPMPTPYKVPTGSTKYSDEEIYHKIEAQKAEFERLCNESDALLKIANKRSVRPINKGLTTPEDQALIDANNRFKRKR